MPSIKPCPDCGLMHQCICGDIPKLDSKLHIALLTHEKEMDRETNTGRFITHSLVNAHIHLWQRTTPPQELTEVLENKDYLPLLLYPAEQSIPVSDAIKLADQTNKIPYFIVLDGTWQEAKKMERKSHWLSSIPRIALSPTHSSQFHLRRNQKENALCTLEIIAELLDEFDSGNDGEKLRLFLNRFMDVFQADKSGHKLHSNHTRNKA